MLSQGTGAAARPRLGDLSPCRWLENRLWSTIHVNHSPCRGHQSGLQSIEVLVRAGFCPGGECRAQSAEVCPADSAMPWLDREAHRRGFRAAPRLRPVLSDKRVGARTGSETSCLERPPVGVALGYRMRGLRGRVDYRWVCQGRRIRLRTVMTSVPQVEDRIAAARRGRAALPQRDDEPEKLHRERDPARAVGWRAEAARVVLRRIVERPMAGYSRLPVFESQVRMARARTVSIATSKGRVLRCTWASSSPPCRVASIVVARASGSMPGASFPSA